MGVWLAASPVSPHIDFTSDLVGKGGGGACGWPVRVCILPSARRCSVLACFGRTLVVASAAQQPEAYRCVGLPLAVASIFGPLKEMLHPKHMLEGIVLWLAGSLHCLVPGHAVAGLAGPGLTMWRLHSPVWRSLRRRAAICLTGVSDGCASCLAGPLRTSWCTWRGNGCNHYPTGMCRS